MMALDSATLFPSATNSLGSHSRSPKLTRPQLNPSKVRAAVEQLYNRDMTAAQEAMNLDLAALRSAMVRMNAEPTPKFAVTVA